MRAGWTILLAFSVAGAGSVAGLCLMDKRSVLSTVLLAGMYVSWIGAGVTAVVMQVRRPTGGLWGAVLELVAVAGLMPVALLAIALLFELLGHGGWN